MLAIFHISNDHILDITVTHAAILAATLSKRELFCLYARPPNEAKLWPLYKDLTTKQQSHGGKGGGVVATKASQPEKIRTHQRSLISDCKAKRKEKKLWTKKIPAS